MPDYNKYFKNFKTVEYNNYKALNLTERVKVIESVYSNPYVFYPYSLKDGDRPDAISNGYYEDPYAAWMVYHANKIIDPYYDWYMSYDDLHKFIIKKYGSIEYAQKKVKFYRVEWASDDQVLSPSYYDSTLPDSGKKYWTANFSPSGSIISYQRKNDDWVMNTNMILRLDVTYNSNTRFTDEEIVNIKNGANTVGNCEVVMSSNTTLTLQHINVEDSGFNLDIETFNTTTPNGSFSVVGETSNASANISAYQALQINIPIDENVYWNRVTLYDYEEENNNSNREIYLLDRAFYQQTTEELKELLRG